MPSVARPFRYVVRNTQTNHKDDLADVIDSCPPNYELHSVVPVSTNQHGTSYFAVIFKPLVSRFG